MPDSRVSDDERKRLTRAHLDRRLNRQPPAAVEERVMQVPLSLHRRSPRLAWLMGVLTLVVVGIVTFGLFLAFHLRTGAPSGAASPNQVEVTRAPGLLMLPPLNRRIINPSTVTRLANGILALPNAPSVCSGGESWDTSYTLTFLSSASPTWTAIISVFGCDEVTLSDGTTRRMQGTALWGDLGNALHLSLDEVEPVACGGPSPAGGLCYPTRGTPSPRADG